MTQVVMRGESALEFAGVVSSWKAEFEAEQELASVDFRSLAPDFAARDRFTHLMHPYPAKLIPEIPHLFLKAGLTCPVGGRPTVVDPFCGSGTVLVEGLLAGFDAIGADSNPLARLLARVKTRPLESARIKQNLRRILQRCSEMKNAEPPPVVNLHYWYSKRIIDELAKIRLAIQVVQSIEVREFMLVCLSACAKKLSYADPRLSVPVKVRRSKQEKYGSHYRQLQNHLKFVRSVEVPSFFTEIVLKNVERLSSFGAALNGTSKVSLFDNAIGLEGHLPPGSADLVITSPPYLGAQKYIRASSLSLGWLDLAYERELRPLERKNLGREHFAKSEVGTAPRSNIAEADRLIESVSIRNSLRAHIAWTYLSEMEQALVSIFGVLREGGYAIVVVGPNTICGQSFDTPTFVEKLAHRVGFGTEFQLLDHIRSRGLMTKRNKTAGLIANEVVLCLQK